MGRPCAAKADSGMQSPNENACLTSYLVTARLARRSRKEHLFRFLMQGIACSPYGAECGSLEHLVFAGNLGSFLQLPSWTPLPAGFALPPALSVLLCWAMILTKAGGGHPSMTSADPRHYGGRQGICDAAWAREMRLSPVDANGKSKCALHDVEGDEHCAGTLVHGIRVTMTVL